MLTLRSADQRGLAEHGWLKSYHSFSFADYYDPKQMGFRPLRVVNEDRVQAGQGFGAHSHRDMEIISYVISGGLQHRDSMGNGSVIRPGDVQLMSAGRGVTHTEFNASQTEQVHFLQIWIVPNVTGGPPAYAEHNFSENERENQFRLVVSPDGEGDSLRIKQDARLYAALLDPGKSISHALGKGRHAWLQVVKGTLEVNGQHLAPGDGLAISDEPKLAVIAHSPSEALLFDLP
jgi:redox-sensitive bicupin YhaK (pirin superfamily)